MCTLQRNLCVKAILIVERTKDLTTITVDLVHCLMGFARFLWEMFLCAIDLPVISLEAQ